MPGKDPTMFQRGQRAQPDAPAPTAGTMRLRIRRCDPDRDPKPHWETYQAPRQPGDRLLDALHHVKWYVDGSLSFRRSCAHGVCGSDAMRVNGVNRLAWKVLLKDLGDEVRVEPIQGLPLAKDLIVDMEPFFASYRAVMPYLITAGHEPTRERLQPPEQGDRYDDTTKCILCAACTGSCPVYWVDGRYVGPATIVNAHRFIFDSRDTAAGVRLEILKGRDGAGSSGAAYGAGLPATHPRPKRGERAQLAHRVRGPGARAAPDRDRPGRRPDPRRAREPPERQPCTSCMGASGWAQVRRPGTARPESW
jgi:succinate dehydrogenase / fumarate reductase iron-sulfur subunit